MFSKDRVIIPSNSARFAKRLAQPFTKQNLLCAVRAIAPALFALTLSSAAHAQGTMDFSGAQTLMGTFNMGWSTVQSTIVFSNSIQIISKQSVSAFDRQRERIRNLQQHAQRRMISCATQVGEQVLRDEFASFGGIAFAIIRRRELSVQFTEMHDRVRDLVTGNRSIHSEGFSQKNLASELRHRKIRSRVSHAVQWITNDCFG